MGRLGLSDKMWKIESPTFFSRAPVRQLAELRMGSLNLWGAVPKRAQGTSGVQFPKGHRESGTVMFQDSHVAKLLGLGVGVDRSCSPPPDAALSGSGWDSSAFLSQLSRQPSQVEETEV